MTILIHNILHPPVTSYVFGPTLIILYFHLIYELNAFNNTLYYCVYRSCLLHAHTQYNLSYGDTVHIGLRSTVRVWLYTATTQSLVSNYILYTF